MSQTNTYYNGSILVTSVCGKVGEGVLRGYKVVEPDELSHQGLLTPHLIIILR